MITFIGLILGISTFIVLYLYVDQQRKVDRFNENFKRIYRLELERCAALQSGVGPEVEENIPEIELSSRVLQPWWKHYLRIQDQDFIEQDIIFADPSFFTIFSHEFIAGSPESALVDPNSIVLTQSMAYKFFGHDSPIGQTLTYGGNQLLTVTGVIKDVPLSHLPISACISYVTLKDVLWGGQTAPMRQLVGSNNFLTYVLARENTRFDEAFTTKLNDHFVGLPPYVNGTEPTFFMRPLSEIYFAQNISMEGCLHGSLTMTIAFLIIAIIVLAIAAINYINISIIQGALRFKELGAKRVLGASPGKIRTQILLESLVFCFAAMALSYLLVSVFLNQLNSFLNIELSMQVIRQFSFWLLSLTVLILLTLISGVYPAYILGRIDPCKVIKGEQLAGKKAPTLRRILIVFQYSISVFLVLMTLSVFKQLKFMKQRDLGFNADNLMIVDLPRSKGAQVSVLEEKFRKIPSITHVSSANQALGGIANTRTITIDNNEFRYRLNMVDPEYIPTLDLEIGEGRNFNLEQPTDINNKYIINEEARKQLGFKPGEAVGSILNINGQPIEIIGVLKDFHYNSVRNKIDPLALSWARTRNPQIHIKYKPGNYEETLAGIQLTWSELIPELPLKYELATQLYDLAYRDDEQMVGLYTLASIIAILLACMGLFGLSGYTIIVRKKELCIRKIVGAGFKEISWLLHKEYLILMIISFIIAIPVGMKMINVWLSQFPYQTQIGVMLYTYAVLLVIMAGIFTVSFHSRRAALLSPMDFISSAGR
ncbi:MAG: FtsX-like permease family protein [Bacteroidetes bacterium]|nr:FtsX-like permease family protein [Bacteroidota bacterium]MBT4411398.1 FtsX-like permease family protein [Bacteroidota bacterium]MBT7464981.1 FtsX-like permease family protein [Bacteroidota bacterium]